MSNRTPMQQAKWKEERESIVGTRLFQPFEHTNSELWTIKRHIRGSVYELQSVDTPEFIYASHKKKDDVWREWEDRDGGEDYLKFKGCITISDDVPMGTLLMNKKDPTFSVVITGKRDNRFLGIEPDGTERHFRYINPHQWNIIGARKE